MLGFFWLAVWIPWRLIRKRYENLARPQQRRGARHRGAP